MKFGAATDKLRVECERDGNIPVQPADVLGKLDNVERVVSERIGRETVQYVSNIYKYYIAYTLVQEDVARTLEKAEAAPAK